MDIRIFDWKFKYFNRTLTIEIRIFNYKIGNNLIEISKFVNILNLKICNPKFILQIRIFDLKFGKKFN